MDPFLGSRIGASGRIHTICRWLAWIAMYHAQTCHVRPCRMKNEACDLDGNLTYRCGLPKGSLVRVCVSMSARCCTNTVVLERHHREMPGLAYHSSHHDTGSWCQLCISAVRSASLQSSFCPQLLLAPTLTIPAPSRSSTLMPLANISRHRHDIPWTLSVSVAKTYP